MNDAQLIVVIVAAILIGLILIWAKEETGETKKLLLNGKESNGRYLFKNILSAFKDSYNLSAQHGALSQLKKIYGYDIANVQNDEVYFICYGIQGITFRYWIITNEHFIYFSKNKGITYFKHNQNKEIMSFIDTQKSWTNVFISYMTKAHDLLENKVYGSSIELVEKKYIDYSGSEIQISRKTDNNSTYSNGSVENKLVKIKELFDNGYISQEEYAEKRDEILKTIL